MQNYALWARYKISVETDCGTSIGSHYALNVEKS